MSAPAEFFFAGGTVPPSSPSYVEREADRQLVEALLKGEYCYVLNSRQMGKSSLAVRTVTRLREAGVRTAFIDLTRIGGGTVTSEQWYAGLLMETGRVLDLRKEAATYLKEQKEIGGAQRLLSFLQEIALPAAGSPLVMMLDEIDIMRSLPFPGDELFAGIRQLHNGRATEPELNRLTFCLLGAALASDLIRDPRTTPFNSAKRIELRDFTWDEAKPLAAALGGEELLKRVLYWTGGHPFLTQSLCMELAQARKDVDRLVRERYLDARARETDTNLADVANRLLSRGSPEVGEQERADTLTLYLKMLNGGIVDDESNPACGRIKMSGVARLENGRLTLRNRIYGHAFDKRWARENMPGQETRRQRRAYWLGALQAGAVGLAVIALVTVLAVFARMEAMRADRNAVLAHENELQAKENEVTALALEQRTEALLAQRNKALHALTLAEEREREALKKAQEALASGKTGRQATSH